MKPLCHHELINARRASLSDPIPLTMTHMFTTICNQPVITLTHLGYASIYTEVSVNWITLNLFNNMDQLQSKYGCIAEVYI